MKGSLVRGRARVDRVRATLQPTATEQVPYLVEMGAAGTRV